MTSFEQVSFSRRTLQHGVSNNNNNKKKKKKKKLQTNGTHTCPSQFVKREMLQCCGIKQYIQTEKLQQIGQI